MKTGTFYEKKVKSMNRLFTIISKTMEAVKTSSKLIQS